MPQLDPTWYSSQLFWLALTFVGLYIVLSRMVLPPLMEVIARRAQTVQGDIETAQRLKHDAEVARANYDKALADSRMKAQTLMNEAIASQKHTAEEKAKELDKQIEKKLAAASAQISAKKTQMLTELIPTTSELVGMIVEKLTQQAPNPEQVHAALGDIAKGKS
jgi:F-type H+-transporting ATPase subunit b